MRPRISIRGSVRPSVRPSVRRAVTPSQNRREWAFCSKKIQDTILCASAYCFGINSKTKGKKKARWKKLLHNSERSLIRTTLHVQHRGRIVAPLGLFILGYADIQKKWKLDWWHWQKQLTNQQDKTWITKRHDSWQDTICDKIYDKTRFLNIEKKLAILNHCFISG